MARNVHGNIINFFETAGLEVATAMLGIAATKVKERVSASSIKEEKATKRAKVARKPRAKKATPTTTAAAPATEMHALSGAEQLPIAETVGVE